MAKLILMDELHVSIYAAQGLRRDQYDAIHRNLMKKGFRTRLRQAVRAAIYKHPSLRVLRVQVSR